MHALFNHPFIGRGFRPFFFLGALYSVISLLIWGGFYAGMVTPPEVFLSTVSWHAHEMIYGFTIAIIAGFLLTAVANWTGGAPARQLHLLSLCLLWLAGRIVMNVDFGLPLYSIFAIECAFVPALAISLSIPLLKNWNKRNFIFLMLLTILFSCDLTFLITENHTPLYIAIMVVIMMISLIGGRIIPAFTVASLRRKGENAFQRPQPKLDIMALISLVLIILTLMFLRNDIFILSIVSFASAIIHALRMRQYYTLRILNDPMVWILHAGYAWVILGLFCLGLSNLGVLPFSTALHALTAGAIGSMILGMICRVTLGHTGRNLIASPLTTATFYLIQVSAGFRVFGTLLLPEYTSFWIISSAFLWSSCFAIYLIIYTPMLWSKRPDGKTT